MCVMVDIDTFEPSGLVGRVVTPCEGQFDSESAGLLRSELCPLDATASLSYSLSL